MKNILFLIIFLIFHKSLNSQTLVPFLKSNGNYVYVDSLSMKIVIDKEFKEATLFENGFASVRLEKGGKWGAINRRGDLVVNPIALGQINFFDGIAEFYIETKSKDYESIFIDTFGIKITEPKKLSKFKSNKHISKNSTDYEIEGFWKNDKYGFKKSNGKIIIPSKYGVGYLSFTKSGFASVAFNVNESEIYIDKSGREFYEKTGSNSINNFCPPDIRNIQNIQFKGTARKYQAHDGHSYFEVILSTNIPQKFIKFYKELQYSVLRNGKPCYFCGDVSNIKTTKSINQKVKYIGCTEKDVFYLEGFYNCSFNGATGKIAKLYFRDLLIIK
jgi:hypothetical protein